MARRGWMESKKNQYVFILWLLTQQNPLIIQPSGLKQNRLHELQQPTFEKGHIQIKMCSEENNVDVLGPEASEEEKIQKRFNICLQIQMSGKMKKIKDLSCLHNCQMADQIPVPAFLGEDFN